MGDDEGGPKLIDDGGGLTLATEITLDISDTITSDLTNEGQTENYDSGGNNTVKVTKGPNVSAGGGTNNFEFYIHTLLAGGMFTLSKTITHTSGTGTLQDETDISDVYEVYYYKHSTDQSKGALKIKTSSDTKIFYNTTIGSSSEWKNATTDPPDANSEAALKALVDKIKDEYEIKADKIKPYGCNKRITVQKKGGDGSSSNPVPDGYVRYKHSSTSNSFKLGLVKYKDIPLKFAENPPTDVQAVYVYYSQNGDTDHEFPLIVCVDTGQSDTRKYHKRGQRWSDAGQPLNGVDPESTTAGSTGGELKKELDKLKDIYEIRLEQQASSSGYKANAEGSEINPQAVTQEGGTAQKYKGFKHSLPGGTGTINRITIHNHVIKGITEVEGSDGYTITEGGGGVYVYFTLSEAGGKREKPLLICLSKDGTKSNSTQAGNNIWYERKNNNGKYTWLSGGTTYDGIKPVDSNGRIEENLKSQLQTINSAVSGDLGYPKLKGNLSDTVKSNPDVGIMDFFNL